MKNIKLKVITLSLSLAIGASTLVSPISAFAAEYYGETTIDGQVTTFYQGQAGDCGAVSAIQAFDNSTYGKEFISSLITDKGNGSYVVNFGSGKQKVSKSDIASAYITGDLDARIIEAAIAKKMDIYNGCFACDVFKIMTGFEETHFYEDNAKSSFMNTMYEMCSSGEGIIAACDFTTADESLGILGDGSHSYSVKSVSDDTVVVVNPWDTSVDISMPRTQFEDSIRYMTYVDSTTNKVMVYWS